MALYLSFDAIYLYHNFLINTSSTLSLSRSTTPSHPSYTSAPLTDPRLLLTIKRSYLLPNFSQPLLIRPNDRVCISFTVNNPDCITFCHKLYIRNYYHSLLLRMEKLQRDLKGPSMVRVSSMVIAINKLKATWTCLTPFVANVIVTTSCTNSSDFRIWRWSPHTRDDQEVELQLAARKCLWPDWRLFRCCSKQSSLSAMRPLKHWLCASKRSLLGLQSG